MVQENEDILKEYAQIKKEINVLENKAGKMKEQVLEILLKMKEKYRKDPVIDIGLDTISIGSRRAWKYTPKVKELKKVLDDQKELEERTGKAEYKENFYPIFTDSDNKKEKEY